MKMTSGWLRFAGPLVLALTVSVGAGPVDVTAQDTRVECRCVDRDGNEIESCSCLRAPRVDGFMSAMGFESGRPRLGLSVDPTQSARNDALGALVIDVLEDGPADEAGIREGDVITSVDGQSLSESIGASSERDFDLDASAPVQRLLALARDLEPDQEVEIDYLRDDEPETATLRAEDLSAAWGSGFSMAVPSFDASRLREQLRAMTDDARSLRFRSRPDRVDGLPFRPEAPDVSVFGPNVRFDGSHDGRVVIGGSGLYRDGLELVELNPELGSYFGATEGVLVVDVARTSGLGLEAGDVVLRVGDRSVETPSRFRRILSSYGQDEDINFLIRRDGAETSVTGRIRY